MNKAEILELAGRVEALEGPDREVDEAIKCALLGATAEMQHHGGNAYHKDGRWISIGEVKPYTSSIDAAMGLVPAESFWRVGHDADDPSGFTAQVSYDRGEGRLGFTTGTASTPAIALTAACLRAIASMMEDDRG